MREVYIVIQTKQVDFQFPKLVPLKIRVTIF